MIIASNGLVLPERWETIGGPGSLTALMLEHPDCLACA